MTKNKEGRPSVFDSPEEMKLKIDEYFTNCPDKRKIVTKEGVVEIPSITITGLCIFLGFESRQSFYDYEKKPEFSYIIKKARLYVERYYEQGLQFPSPTGSIFALKNMGWFDKSEIDHNVSIPKLPDIIIR
jgi:hypothetical protein